MSAKSKFNLVAIGGTFDRLHAGHRHFIKQAFEFGDRVLIGLTSQDYADRKIKRLSHLGRRSRPNVGDSPEVEGFGKRRKKLEEFLSKEKLLKHAEIVKIDDLYGSSADEAELEAIVVTKDSLSGALLINKKRRKKGLPELKIIKIKLLNAQDEIKISSTRIRQGEIDSFGRIFSRLPIFNKKFSEPIRLLFKSPQGRLIKGDSNNLEFAGAGLLDQIKNLKPAMIITCGDEATKLANQLNIPINLSIFDFQVQRKEKYHSFKELLFKEKMIKNSMVLEVKNMAGVVSKALLAAVRKAVLLNLEQNRQVLIKVSGEEDLGALPAILLAPLGGVVIYGQPAEGIVIVQVTPKIKQKLLQVFN